MLGSEYGKYGLYGKYGWLTCHSRPKNPLTRPQTSPNSFVNRNLHITLTRRRICAGNRAMFMKTRNYGGGGGEGKVVYPPFQNGNYWILCVSPGTSFMMSL